MNYFNYFTEIEDTFVRRRGKHLFLSPMDWALMETWKQQGIPLHIVLRGIERSFDSFESRPRKRTVKSLLYCQEEVEAQYAEWNADRSLDWHLLEHAAHQGVRRLVRDLNNVYRHFPALHELDHDGGGFEWIVHDDADQSVFAFVRRARDGAFVIAVCNFTPVPRVGYRLGVPLAGSYREIINTDGVVYGGSGVGNGVVESEPVAWHGKADSLSVSLPPSGTVMWVLV